MKTFDPRDSKCPICKCEFRKDCNHSIEEAERKLFEDYIKSLNENKR